jgi:hypothetical protein
VSSASGDIVFHCRYLQPDDKGDELDPAALVMSGPIARKNGSLGKQRYGSARLFSDEWKLVGRARPDWLENCGSSGRDKFDFVVVDLWIVS